MDEQQDKCKDKSFINPTIFFFVANDVYVQLSGFSKSKKTVVGKAGTIHCHEENKIPLFYGFYIVGVFFYGGA